MKTWPFRPTWIPALALSLAAAAPALAAGIPNDLSLFVKSGGKLEARTVRYRGHDIKERLDPRFKAPVLVWEIPATMDLEALLRDLVLTPRGFDGRFALRRDAGAQGIKYDLFADGVRVDEAWVRAEADQATGQLALAVHLPPRNDLALDSEALPDGFAFVRDGILAYDKAAIDGGAVLRFHGDAPVPELQVLTLTPKKAEGAELEKIPLTRGTFPDQIKVHPSGKVFFTQPSNNILTSYDPATKEFAHVEVGSLPDGLGLDHLGRLWFGEYGNKKLGMYDPASATYKQFDPDYDNSKPAIPHEDTKGRIWITDHESNRVGRFDPETSTYKSIAVPSANAWAVDLVQTSDAAKMWVTECYANKLGTIDVESLEYKETALPTSSCAAFFVPVGTDLYVSLWQAGSFLKVDTVSGEVTELKVEGASGFGPIDRMPDGTIVLGSLHDGKVYHYDPATRGISYVEKVGTLKDGIAAGPDGTVWVTEMGAFIYRLRF